MQNDRVRHDEYLLDLDQVAGCCQPSNLSSDFPLGSRKFSSYNYFYSYTDVGFLREGIERSVSLYMPIHLFYELKKYEDISYAHFLC